MLNGFWASNFKTSQMCKWRFSSDTQTGLPRKLSRWYSGALKQRNKTQRNKKNYVYTVKYMKSSSPDDSSLMQHAIIPTLPPSLLPLPSRPLPTSHTSPFQKQIVGYPSWYLGFRAGGGLETGHTPAWDVSLIVVYPCPVGMGFFPTVRVGVILLL